MSNNSYKQGFIKRASQHGLSHIEAEVVFEKMAAGMPGGQPPGAGGPPSPHGQPGGPPHGQPPGGGGNAQVTVNGQPLPPELAHVVMQVLQKLTEGGGAGGQPGGGAGGPPQGGHPGM